MEDTELKVEGMTCSGCVRSVTNALSKMPGVADVSVSLADRSARVKFDPARVSRAAIRQAVLDAGYESP
ncbi:MAG: heavy-metal-associated domain-containing protein [Burkholderiales bacterium]